MRQKAAYYVVGIGLSAGGLEALQKFLTHLSFPTKASFVIISHLPMDTDSRLDKVLMSFTPLKISWIMDGTVPEPECLYILPPGQQLTFQGKAFQLKPRMAEKKVNYMIDHGFRALSEAFGRKVIGIILSGMGKDGLEGVKAIETQGGVVLVQHPETARFQSMPASVISQDHPDMIATPEQLATMLMRLL